MSQDSESEDRKVPAHLGLILDGNRRWAKAHDLPTLEGHSKGYENLKTIGRAAFDAGVEYVSAYVFSTENWNRSKEEVGYLMKLVVKIVSKDLAEFIDNNIRVVFLGSRDRVPKAVLQAMQKAEQSSAQNTGGTLALCFNYGGQQEIADAVRTMAHDGVDVTQATSENIANYLYEPSIPPVDFMIRTSGEMRISNFMLWRMAYAELYFADKHWPEFTPADLQDALNEYARRQRRFGK